MKKQILLVYLAIIILLLNKFEPLLIILILFPIVILSYAFLTKNKGIGIVGFALFQFLALPTFTLLNYDNIQEIVFSVIVIIIPSLILLKVILNLENKKIIIVKPQAKPVLIIILILSSIIVFIFVLTQISLFDIYLKGSEAKTIQILLLVSMTIITCTPFLERAKI